MTTITAPIAVPARARKSRMLLTLPLVLVFAIAAAWLAKVTWTTRPRTPLGTYFTLQKMDLDVKIVKDGELQAVNNIDINCMVEGQTTIQQLVSEGSYVKKGEVLVTLDSAPIKQKIEDSTLDVQKAEADLITAKEMKEIQVSQNGTNLDAAQVALTLAKLDLQQFEEGSYPQQLASAQTDVDMAKISLKNAEEDLGQTRALAAKGYVTPADVKKSELAVTTATQALNKATTALKVLTKYTYEMDLATKKNALAQAEQKVVRAQRENASNLAQKEADLQAKEQALGIKKRALAHLNEQLENCTIEAPADGLVVFASGDRWSGQNAIQEGTQVRERQQILRLPDTSAMKAIARIQEAQVPKLKIGQRAMVEIVGVRKPIGATLSKISVLADSNQRWWNPDLKEYPVELVLDETPSNLKPGIGVKAEVYVDRLHDVLAVPLNAIYAAGDDNYVFVKNESSATPVKVAIGDSNETHVQVTKGLSAGQEVLILGVGQGRELIDQAGIQITPTTRPSDPELTAPRRPRPAQNVRPAGGDAKQPAVPNAAPSAAPAVKTGAPAEKAKVPAPVPATPKA